jgi:hypothetical protein
MEMYQTTGLQFKDSNPNKWLIVAVKSSAERVDLIPAIFFSSRMAQDFGRWSD